MCQDFINASSEIKFVRNTTALSLPPWFFHLRAWRYEYPWECFCMQHVIKQESNRPLSVSALCARALLNLKTLEVEWNECVLGDTQVAIVMCRISGQKFLIMLIKNSV